MSNVLDIDGGILEGGGQVLRMAVAFSVLKRIPVRIYNIRAGRSNPGLSPQHLKGLELAREVCQGKLIGAKQRSTEVTFYPGDIKPGEYFADTETAGSVVLMVQLLLPCILFSSGTTMLDLQGGTNAEMAPQIDYMTTVMSNFLQKFGASFEYDLIRRGFYPKGGGKLRVSVRPIKYLKPVELLDPGKFTRIWGTAYTAGNCPFVVSKQMGQSAEHVLKKALPSLERSICIKQIKETPEKAFGTGSGIYIFAETSTGCMMAGTALGRREIPAESVGIKAANELLQAIQSGACVDAYTQDQVIILMALAKGKSRILTGPITLHTETAIYIAKLMTEANFTVHKQDKGLNIIECEGIGFENTNLN